MNILKPLVYVLAAIGLAYVSFLVFWSISPSCEIADIRIAISPSKQHEARLIEETCPKHDPSLVLRLTDKDTPNKSVNSTIAMATTTNVDITWLAENKLQVAYPQSLQLTQQPSQIDGVEIVFIAKP